MMETVSVVLVKLVRDWFSCPTDGPIICLFKETTLSQSSHKITFTNKTGPDSIGTISRRFGESMARRALRADASAR